MMEDKNAIVAQIIEQGKEGTETIGTLIPPMIEQGSRPKDIGLFFETFKGVRGQLYAECDRIKGDAFQKAYDEVMADSKHLENVKNGRLSVAQHEELARQQGREESDKALPKQPLGIALMLRQYIRFVRVKPEAQGQKAPLYFYNPDDGIWLEDNELLQDLISIINPHSTEKQALDTLYKIARKSNLRSIQRQYTVIGDQLYNAKVASFEPITHQAIVTRKIKTKYKPNATEPIINGWKVTEWLRGLFDGDHELYRLAIQIIKASVTGQSLKKIFWLYGEGGTGKGTFQQLLINLAGMENVASLKITELNNSRFSKSILLGKSLVIGDDVQMNAPIKDTSEMFSLATGDIMTIEDKGKRPYSLRLNVTIIQSSNGLPMMTADKGAIDRRFRILPFTKVFKDQPNKAIKDDYINRPEVLEYLVKLAIETPLEDLNPLTSKALLDDHQKDMNPILDFVSQYFTDDLVSEFLPNDFIFHIWKGFVEYYDINTRTTQTGLHREIKKHLPIGFVVGQKVIPAGRQHHKGFYPKEDLPFYAWTNYSNGRETETKQKKPKNDRGYFNNRASPKKKR